MPSPSSSLATLRPDLAASVEEFNLANDRAGFIGLRVLPVFDAGEASGHFGRIPIEQLLQHRSTERAPGAGYSRGTWKFEPDTYSTQERGAEEPIDDNTVKAYRHYFDAEQVCAQRAYDAVLRDQEQRVADLLFNATTFAGHTSDVTNEWDENHKTDAVPIDNVEKAVRAVWTASGIWPDALIINRLVFRNLRNLDQIVDRITATGAGSPAKPSDITAAMLAAVFDLREVIVAGSPKNTADEGQDLSISSIWSSEYAMVAKLCRSNDLREPGLGRTFHWSEDGSQVGGMMEVYREEAIRGDIVRCRHQIEEKLIYVEAGYLLGNVTTL